MADDSQDGESVDIGHLHVDTQGNATFKRLPTNQLVEALQLSIPYSVGGLEARPAHDVLCEDFLAVEIVHFPKTGRTIPKATAPHRFSDFTISSYAPVAFRHFRENFNIKPEDYLSSIYDEFIIKTVQKKEAEFLKSLLPGYYMNVTQNQRTLLPKFYGLYCYQLLLLLNVIIFISFLIFYCLSPIVALAKDLKLARSLIFASGTLALLSTYSGELKISFDIQIDKILFGECGLAVLDVCQRVPYGVLYLLDVTPGEL
ncbi:unnamed protein product [Rotaria sp. Silwood1]|nr:unnamed protein product [Rotaria sp. Silwood1]